MNKIIIYIFCMYHVLFIKNMNFIFNYLYVEFCR